MTSAAFDISEDLEKRAGKDGIAYLRDLVAKHKIGWELWREPRPRILGGNI